MHITRTLSTYPVSSSARKEPTETVEQESSRPKTIEDRLFSTDKSVGQFLTDCIPVYGAARAYGGGMNIKNGDFAGSWQGGALSLALLSHAGGLATGMISLFLAEGGAAEATGMALTSASLFVAGGAFNTLGRVGVEYKPD